MKQILIVIACMAFGGAVIAAEPNEPPKAKTKKHVHGQTGPAAAQPQPPIKGSKAYHRPVSTYPPATHRSNVSAVHHQHIPSQTNFPSGTSHRLPAVQKFHTRQFHVATKPKADIPSARFQANRHIHGSENWHGAQYQAFRNYHAEWHDGDWWRQHHHRIVFIYGGWYFWNAGWWYPAWGYDPYAYYPYDGPIYAYNDLPPDQVIANVQAALQQGGYYTGEIDGILGPLTRAALAQYQEDHGLYTTSAIDQPTLEALGMG
jgi:Putative peptidoglycan binding domain